MGGRRGAGILGSGGQATRPARPDARGHGSAASVWRNHGTIRVAPDYAIRAAVRTDIDTLVAFTLQEASEAEGIEADPEAVRRGVRAAFDEPLPAAYWVAETPDGSVAASVSVVTEWSNFHGGYYWWVQSLFVAPAHRGRGLAERLLDHLARAAETRGALDLRLHVHNSNRRALRAYHRCGFGAAPYSVMTRDLRSGRVPQPGRARLRSRDDRSQSG